MYGIAPVARVVVAAVVAATSVVTVLATILQPIDVVTRSELITGISARMMIPAVMQVENVVTLHIVKAAQRAGAKFAAATHPCLAVTESATILTPRYVVTT